MIGQIYYYNLFISKKYYFCLLFTLITGLKSFKDLKTINNHLYSSFHTACMVLILLKND